MSASTSDWGFCVRCVLLRLSDSQSWGGARLCPAVRPRVGADDVILEEDVCDAQ